LANYKKHTKIRYKRNNYGKKVYKPDLSIAHDSCISTDFCLKVIMKQNQL